MKSKPAIITHATIIALVFICLTATSSVPIELSYDDHKTWASTSYLDDFISNFESLSKLSGISMPAVSGKKTEDLIGVFSIKDDIILGDSPAKSSTNDLTATVSLDPRTGPRLVSFNFWPNVVNTTLGPQTVNFDMCITNSSTVRAASNQLPNPTNRYNNSFARFVSPSAGNRLDVFFAKSDVCDTNTSYYNSSCFIGNMTIDDDFEKGDWTLQDLWLKDDNGDGLLVDADYLESAGFPFILRIT